MDSMRAILDIHNIKIFFLGNGDYDLLQVLAEGTEVFDAVRVQSCHIGIPCRDYNSVLFPEQPMAFLTGRTIARPGHPDLAKQLIYQATIE